MFNLLLIETAQREREREIREAVRRRRLMAGGQPEPEVASRSAAVRAARRERQGQPVRVVAP